MQPARRFLWIQIEDEKKRPDVSAIRSHTATHRHRDRRLTNMIRFREYKKQQQSSKVRMPVPARPDLSSRGQ